LPIIQIFLLILVLASFVIAYFAARTWHWGHVLVMLGIFLSTLGFFVLTAETLRINAVLRKQVNNLDKQINQVEAKNLALEAGTDDASLVGQLRNEEVRIPEDAERILSLADLDHQLALLTRIRGRVWRDVKPAGFDPQAGTFQIGVEAPTPAGFSPASVVFLFEQGDPALPDPTRGKQYLGEFRVRQATGQQATLEPVLPLDQFEQQRLAKSGGPWVMYESMPMDRHEIFAGKSEEQIRQLIPEQSVGEYLRHGQEAGPDDNEWHRAGVDENGKRVAPDQQAAKTVYQRRLRDYALEFEQLAQQRALLLTDMEGVRQDNQRLAAANESGKKLQAFREDERRRLGIDLTGIQKERRVIEHYLSLLQAELTKTQEKLAQTLRENSRLVQELAHQQAAGGASAPIQQAGLFALDWAN